MYRLAPSAVYAHETVMSNPVYRARAARVAAALEQPREIITYGDADVEAMATRGELAGRRAVMGTLPEVEDPVLLFNTFRFDPEEQAAVAERAARLKEAGADGGGIRDALLGRGAFHWAGYNQPGDKDARDKVCRPCWRIHLENGCVHRCKYCSLGGVLAAMVNVEEYCTHLGAIIERHPWQKTFLLDDDADPPALEPELGVLGPLIEFFGTLEDRYLIIHTKTWNTEWMRGLKHNGNTIIVWSISGPTQSREIEPKAGTTEQRIAAARIAQEAGYQIRYKFKPIIPVRDWRREAAETIDMLFDLTDPDIISLCCFMWMDVDEMKRRLASVLDLLDPECVGAAEEHREEVKDTRTRPFPHDVRARIYDHYLTEIRRRSPTVPVSLSTENWKMWAAFGPRLGMTATNYVCGCGPQCVPGARRLVDHPFKVAVRDEAAIPGSQVPAEVT